MDLLRIHAGEDGESHFEEVTLEREVLPAEAGVAELWQSAALDVDRLHLVTVKAAEQRPDWHRAPRRQLVVFLDGWVDLTVSDGERRRLPAGGVLLVEDTEGRGHVTEHQPGDRRVLVIPLSP